jgi:hypothetical protein
MSGDRVVQGERGLGPLPVTKRGVEFGLDFLTLTIRGTVRSVAQMITRAMGLGGVGLEVFERLPGGGMGFKRIYLGPGGWRLYGDPAVADRRGEFGYCTLQVGSQGLALVDVEGLRDELRDLRTRGVKISCSRIDLAWTGVAFGPGDVLEALKAGEVRTLAKRATFRELKDLHGPGHTVYMGSRTSERYLRCYRKVGGGDDGRDRIEMECKGERAERVFDDWLGLGGDEWRDRAMGHLRDYVDFGRGWWGEFTRGVVRAMCKIANAGRASIERSLGWVEKAVAPTLAMLAEAFGGDMEWLYRLLMIGGSRYGPKQRYALAAAGMRR